MSDEICLVEMMFKINVHFSLASSISLFDASNAAAFSFPTLSSKSARNRLDLTRKNIYSMIKKRISNKLNAIMLTTVVVMKRFSIAPGITF